MRHNYTYHAFGDIKRQTGNTENHYLFAGEQKDSYLDNYYLRQRYYSVLNGNFISHDRFEGFISNPLSQHKYQFANRNPILNADPSGYFAVNMGEVGAALAILAILSTIPTFTPGVYATLTAQEERLSDDVIVYIGSSPDYPLGHAAIEVDGFIYDYDGSPGITARNEFIAEEQERYRYSYQKYSLGYKPGDKQVLRNNLEINQQTNYTVGQYVIGLPIVEGYAYNCTTYITDSLPSRGSVFDNLVKSQFFPYGLGWGLDVISLLTQKRMVKRLPDINYSDR
jgi:RHS repeat-associated protein